MDLIKLLKYIIKQKMKKFTIHIIGIINILVCTNSFAQDLDSSFQIAKKYYNSGNISEAKSSLLKIVFLDSSNQYSGNAYELSGDIEATNLNMAKAHMYF